jgi:glycosyltransferase involved in cell wall biosynthesis/O-antigen/teichoic acid export membrane protein
MVQTLTKADSLFRRLQDNDTFSSLTIMSMRVGMLAAKFILSIFMARYMGLKEIGIYGLIVGASGTVQAVLRGGIFLLICRDVVRQSRFELMHDLRHYISGILFLYLLLAPVAIICGQYWGEPAVAILILCVFLTDHLAFDSYVLINNLQYPKLANFVYSLQSAVWIYLLVICAVFYEPFRSLKVLLAFWTGGGLMALGIVLWLTRDWPWKKVFSQKLQLQWYLSKMRSSARLYFADVLGVVNYYLDRYIVSLFLSLEMTGIYVFFSQVMTATWNLVNSGVLVVYAPHLIRAYDPNNTAPFNKFYRQCIKRTYMATLGLALLSGVTVPFIVTLTGNRALLDHMPLLWVMLLALHFKIGGTCAGSGLFAMHKDREKFMLEVITFFVTALVGSIAAMAFGVYGVVLNTIIGSSLSMVYAGVIWKKNSKIVAKNYESETIIPTEYKKPKNILIVSSIFPPHIFGGAEIAAYNRAKLLARRGYNVNVVTLHEKDAAPAWGDLTSEGFRLYRIKMPRPYTLFERTRQISPVKKLFWHLQEYFDRRNARQIGDVLDHVKPDHVEIDNLVGIGFNTLAEIGRRNVSVAYILHDLNLACFRTCMFREGKICQRQCKSCRMVAMLRQAPLKKISRLGFISPSRTNLENAKRFIPAINRSSACVIRNVPEPLIPGFKKEHSDHVRLLFAGRIDPVKGIEFLLDTLDPLSCLYKFHLTILGTGPCEQQLKDKYREKTWVTFRGFVPGSEVTEALMKHDIYCIPSLMAETYGLVTAQSLQLGTPVLGSNIGGTAELIRDGVTGMLIAPGDSKAWTEAFSKIFSDHSILDSWRKNAADHAHEFDENTIGQAHEEFISKLHAQSS